jgi:hypothetical protein
MECAEPVNDRNGYEKVVRIREQRYNLSELLRNDIA